MNYIKHLAGFFEKVALDNSLNPSHISLYMALFLFWNSHRFNNPISISRDEMMRISKVCSRSTYHKCLWHLHSRGYINYEPSHNPFKGSLIYLFDFSDNLKGFCIVFTEEYFISCFSHLSIDFVIKSFHHQLSSNILQIPSHSDFES